MNKTFLSKDECTILKGIAILTVILSHTSGILHLYDDIPILGNGLICTSLCEAGMPLFLFISGYGLHISYTKQGLTDYWAKKLITVLIPFWAVQLITMLVYDAANGNSHSFVYNISVLSGINASNLYDPTMWYISYIFFWYLLFYIAYGLGHGSSVSLLIIGSASLAGFKYIPFYWGNNADYCIMTFLAGVLTARITSGQSIPVSKHRIQSISVLAALLLAIIGYTLMIRFHRMSILTENLGSLAAGAAFIILIKLINNKYSFPVLRFFGAISFPLYLLEWKLIINNRLYDLAGAGFITCGICFIATVMLCILFNKAFIFLTSGLKSSNPDKTELRNSMINLSLLIIYFLLNLWISGYHEAWRDESQAWVLVRNSTIPEIFSLCASEGHPCLWFLFLYPFTRLGFSFYYFSYISISIMTVAAALWLWKAPFGLFTRICVLLSPLFFYYNPVICRTYSLVMVLMLLLCILWKDRQYHPVYYGILVALLIQSHILVSGFAAGCILDMLLELRNNTSQKKIPSLIGPVISVASFILLILELRQDSETEAFLNVNSGSILNNIRPTHVYEVLLSFTSKFGRVTGWLILLASLLFIIYLFRLYIKDALFRSEYKREFIIMLCAMGVYCGVMFLVRSADHIQIAIIFWIFLMFICWVGMLKEDIGYIHRLIIVFLTGICILDMPVCLYSDIKYEINEQYSGGKEICNLIKENIPAGSTIVLRNDLFSPSIYAYIAEDDVYSIWDIENIAPYSIHKWGKIKPRELTDDEVPIYIQKDFHPGDDVYFVATSKLKDNNMTEFLFSNSSPSKWHEDFSVYHVKIL